MKLEEQRRLTKSKKDCDKLENEKRHERQLVVNRMELTMRLSEV